PLLPGDPRTVGGYRTVGRLGSGGMGAVYAAADPSGRLIAVKLVHADLAADRDFRARFHREASLVRRVVSPCVPRFVASDTRAAQPWLATEYVPGPTLRRHVDEHGPLSGAPLHAFATGVAEALRAVHAAGIVHRDLKPGNVMLSPEGPKVLDFGIARALHETAITRTGGLFGTPGWVAPELLRGAPPGPAADVFAWGGLVAFAATGRAPFGTGNQEALIHRTRQEEPDLDGVAPELLDLVRRAMDKDPGRRPTAAQALAELTGGWSATRVRPAGRELPTLVVPDLIATEWRGVDAPGTRRVRRFRTGRALTAVGAALLVPALLAVWMFARPDARDDGGTAGGTPPGQEGSAPTADTGISVEDGPGSVARAVDLALGASSFDAYSSTVTNQPGGYPTRFRYTEDPRPLYQRTSWGGPALNELLVVGEGPDDTVHRYTLYDTETQGFPDRGYFRGGEGLGIDPDRGALVEDLAWIAESGAEVEYLGERALPVGEDDTTEDVADLSGLVGRTGHHYSGSYTRELVDTYDDTSYGEHDHTFEVWLDGDGYPLVFQKYYEWEDPGWDPVPTTTTVTYVSFNEPVEIRVPGEDEIAASQAEAVEPQY
ncbi:serine/threonine-protein kinase, partial [Nocardiopsis tropica]|nr:serine/threonine-protein kinase [Nocardiopsis tropica]